MAQPSSPQQNGSGDLPQQTTAKWPQAADSKPSCFGAADCLGRGMNADDAVVTAFLKRLDSDEIDGKLNLELSKLSYTQVLRTAGFSQSGDEQRTFLRDACGDWTTQMRVSDLP